MIVMPSEERVCSIIEGYLPDCMAKRYNKTKKYDYVLVKAGDNLLIANPKFNITNDIVKGLNKRYKIKPEVAEQIKANKE